MTSHCTVASCIYKISICLYFFTFFVLSVASSKDVYFLCKSQCQNTEESNHTQVHTCSVQNINKFPYPSSDSEAKSARQPVWVDSSWKIYQKSDGISVIVFNLTWREESVYFDTYVKGYVLEITRTRSLVSWKRQFTLSTPNHDQLLASNYILVNYNCYGLAADEMVKPGHVYILSLFAMPMYHEYADPMEAHTSIEVPDCDDDSVSIVEHCKGTEEDDYYSDDEYEYIEDDHKSTVTMTTGATQTKGTWLVVMLVVSCVLLLVVLVFVGFCLWRKQKANKNQSLLILMSTIGSQGHSLYFDAAGYLANIIKEFGDVEVSFNLWDMTKINKCSSDEWMEKKLQSCDHIVLICSPLGKDNCEKELLEDPFVLGIKKVVSLRRKIFVFKMKSSLSYSVVYFDDVELSVPDVLDKSDRNFYKVFKEFRSFFYNVTGKQYSKIPSSSIKKLKEVVAKLNSNTFQLQRTSTNAVDVPFMDNQLKLLSDTNDSDESCITSSNKHYQTETMSTRLSDDNQDAVERDVLLV